MTPVAEKTLCSNIWMLVHDGACGALLPALQQATAAEWTFGDELNPQPGERWVLAFDARRPAAALKLQDQARAVGAGVLLVALEPGSVSFGPWVDVGAQACLGCQQRWTTLNLGPASAPPAGAPPAPHPAPHPARHPAQTPCTPQQRVLFEHLLAAQMAQPERLAGAALRLSWHTLVTERHAFQRHPLCPHCAAPPADSAQSARLTLQPRPLVAGSHRVPNDKLSVASLRANFVDRRSGVIKHLFHDLASELMPMVAAEMVIEGTTAVETGYGRTDSREGSERVAMLEALERFCGHRPRRHGRSERGSFEQLRRRHGSAVVDPRDFVLHDAVQMALPTFALEPYSDALPFDWSWGWSMRRDQAVLVPQQLVYYRLGDEPAQPVNRFVYDTSSGCAMGGCIEEATLYGLLEVLERDAYLSAWYGRIPPRELDLDTVADARVRALVARSRAQGFEVHAFDMRLDIDVPLVWAMIVDPSDAAPVKSYCASAAHFHWEQALFAALVEVTTSIGVYRRSMPPLREQALALAADPLLVRGMADHVLLYSLPETWPRLRFLFDGGPAQPLPLAGAAPRDLRDELERRVQQTLQVASDVIVVDQTWAPMAALDLHCVKVLAPGLTPVTFGHQHRRCSIDRLNAARRARGMGSIDAAAINPEPHNFP